MENRTLNGYRPLIVEARLGAHTLKVWNRSSSTPWEIRVSMFFVSVSPPLKWPRSFQPRSSACGRVTGSGQSWSEDGPLLSPSLRGCPRAVRWERARRGQRRTMKWIIFGLPAAAATGIAATTAHTAARSSTIGSDGRGLPPGCMPSGQGGRSN